jgi:hypothetical protein
MLFIDIIFSVNKENISKDLYFFMKISLSLFKLKYLREKLLIISLLGKFKLDKKNLKVVEKGHILMSIYMQDKKLSSISLLLLSDKNSVIIFLSNPFITRRNSPNSILL